MKTAALVASVFVAAVSAHGNLTSPPARQAGAAMATICGQGAVDSVNADPTIPIEDLGTINAGCKWSVLFSSNLPTPRRACLLTPSP